MSPLQNRARSLGQCRHSNTHAVAIVGGQFVGLGSRMNGFLTGAEAHTFVTFDLWIHGRIKVHQSR